MFIISIIDISDQFLAEYRPSSKPAGAPNVPSANRQKGPNRECYKYCSKR